MVKRIRTKVQENIDENCCDLSEKLMDIDAILGISDSEEDDHFPPMIEGRCYFLKSDRDNGIYRLHTTVFGASIFHLFKHVVTGVKSTYSVYTIKADMEECRAVSDQEVAEYIKAYDQEMLMEWSDLPELEED